MDDIYADPGAMVAHFNHPGALDKIWPLCDELISVDNSMALLRTSVENDTWES